MIRIVKLFLISAFILFLVVTTFAFLLPSNIRISRAVNIHTSKENIHSCLTHLQKWPQWNQFIINYQDSSFPYRITAESIKNNKLIVQLIPSTPNSIHSIWHLPDKRSFTSGFSIIPSSNNITIVQWYFDFHIPWYPWEKFGSILYNKQMGPGMEKSLANLKECAEIK